MVPNHVVRDVRLSWKARGLLVWLLSMPDHWRTSSMALAKQGPDGREAVRTGLSELAAAGYLQRRKTQAADGTWSTSTYVFDTPQDPVQNVAASPQPACDYPTPVNRTPKQRTISNDLPVKSVKVSNVRTRLCRACLGTGHQVTGSSTITSCATCHGDGLAH